MSSQTKQAPELNRADTGAMADTALSSTLDSSGHTHNTAPTRFVEVDGIRFAYRRFGNPVGTPIVLLQHLQQNLPNAELILFPDSNHGSQFQFTELFNRYVTDFVDR
jgi:hypothetical protein